jgi:dihydroneopterin aldolase
MATTAIEGMHFHAYHGVHPQEGITGNRFTVDAYFQHGFEGETDDPERCIDYEQVYRMVAARMNVRVQLIEHLACLIADELKTQWPEAGIRVRVSKHHPLPYGRLDRTYAEISR